MFRRIAHATGRVGRGALVPVLFALALLFLPFVAFAQEGPVTANPFSPDGLLALVFGTIVAPFVTQAMKRLSWVDEKLGAGINLLVCLGFYLGAWRILGGVNGFPADYQAWIAWALMANGIGVSGYNVIAKNVGGARRRSALLLVGLLGVGAALPLAACATAPAAPLTATQRLYSTWGQGLEASVAVYEETLRAAGRAHTAGLVTDEQLDLVRKAGHQAEAALRLARAALLAWIERPEGDAPATAIFAAHRSILALLEVARALDVDTRGAS